MRASACERLARRPLTGHWFRALRLRHWSSRLSTDQSRTSRSRFSAASPSNPLFRILYLGETHQVAVHEVGALLGDPNAPVANPKGSWAILSLSVVLEQVVDLTDSTQQRIIRTNQSELTGNWINYAGVSPTQHLGEALYHLPGLVGFIFGSSKVPANCLAIFPDKLSASSSVTFDNEMTGRTERMN